MWRWGLENPLFRKVISVIYYGSISLEKSNPEAGREAVFEAVMQSQDNSKELEANLLYRFNYFEGSLSGDDKALIDTYDSWRNYVVHQASLGLDDVFLYLF